MLLFTASWCNPCNDLKQWLVDKDIEVNIVDVDSNPELTMQNNVRGIPCLVVGDKRYVGREEIKPYLESLDG